MDDKIMINLKFGDGSIPIWIYPKDEAIYRKAAKEVEQKINAYRQHYNNLERERILTMTAFHFALACMRLECANDTQPIIEKLEELSSLMNDSIKSSL